VYAAIIKCFLFIIENSLKVVGQTKAFISVGTREIKLAAAIL